MKLMEKEQELEWTKAQSIVISVDLVAAAKQQLQFLAAVDRNRHLYKGPALQRAIYRYNACWLPLLAKHSESQVSEGPLVVPLDCEWIWHCHRLNPVRYKTDCEELYGKILDNSNVVSSVQGFCKSKTGELWNSLYPEEHYNFNLQKALSEDISERISQLDKCTKYDLVSAIKRQCPFFYQVSAPHMNHDLFLEGAVSRYKGFLHLIKSNNEKSLRRFCVPTYDIDLIWHTHQLHPVSYCKDLHELLGKVLEHDDMDSDRTKGKKLDTGFSGTTKQWEEAFGTSYWRAGAMYRGSAPSPVTTTPYQSNIISKDAIASPDHQKVIELPEVKAVEVLLEFLEVRNLPEGHKGIIFASFSKTTQDIFSNTKRRLGIFSEYGEKQVASFQCEPTGELLFELMSHSPSHIPMKWTYKTLGSASFSLQDFLLPPSKLYVEKCLEMVPSSEVGNLKPIYLQFAMSFTIPTIAQHTLHLVRSRPFSKSSCFLPFAGKNQNAKSWTQVVDETGTEVLRLQMRVAEMEKGTSVPRKEVVGITKSGKVCTLAECVGTSWSLIDTNWSLHREKNSEGHLFLLKGKKMVKFFPGRKLDYEPKHSATHTTEDKTEQHFMTLVEFSAEDPYGKAVALLDLKAGCVKIKEESVTVPGIILAFILSNKLKKESYDGFAVNAAEMGSLEEEIHENPEEGKGNKLSSSEPKEVKLTSEVIEGNVVTSQKGGGCSGACGSGCGNATRSAGSGGGGCGNMEKSSGCGSGCGGGCGSLVKSGGCGGCGAGCGGGGGCGNILKSSGCGGCGSGCGNMLKSGGCGGSGGCGLGCGSLFKGNGYHGNTSGNLCAEDNPKAVVVISVDNASQ
ncbi:glycine-rich domain-containing protein 1 [Argentina anserina]|uniref:glycine-rich domain-containing protein 1 n=1 Tax=Argentina anserina TaxID=57926 RepID=UPI0021764698|nr:glycine-rich domain-containing protein 1 [Potentilla anserina]XP_050365889.1 glycine-rich domain-containing protein 1 [Potentilla anserina]XP_050365899.1 glycine-rich domain-containing protein 1 [Potentilla anserina]